MIFVGERCLDPLCEPSLQKVRRLFAKVACPKALAILPAVYVFGCLLKNGGVPPRLLDFSVTNLSTYHGSFG